MKDLYHYTSYWKIVNGYLILVGVIVATRWDMKIYFPLDVDKDSAEEWNGWLSGARWYMWLLDPINFLKKLVTRGNGITEEYDEVRQISAPSFEKALRKAWEETLVKYGYARLAYEPVEGVSVHDLGEHFI